VFSNSKKSHVNARVCGQNVGRRLLLALHVIGISEDIVTVLHQDTAQWCSVLGQIHMSSELRATPTLLRRLRKSLSHTS